MCVRAYVQNLWQLEFQFHQRALKIALLELKTRFCVCQDVCTYICPCVHVCINVCICVYVFAFVYLCKLRSNDLLSYLFIYNDAKTYLRLYVQYIQVCVI